jgi:hypothetical protein
MTIDDAIKMLEDAKKRGVTDIIIAHWEPDAFGLETNPDWPAIAEQVMDKDWSYVNDMVDDMVAEVDDPDYEEKE